MLCYTLCMHGFLWWVVLFSICFAVPNRNRLCTSGGKDSLCSMQTMDVIWAGLDTHQDNLVTIFSASHSFISWEDNLRDLQNLSNEEPSEAVQQWRSGTVSNEWHVKKYEEFRNDGNTDVKSSINRLHSITSVPFVQLDPRTLQYMSTFAIKFTNINQCAQQDHSEQVNNKWTTSEQWVGHAPILEEKKPCRQPRQEKQEAP